MNEHWWLLFVYGCCLCMCMYVCMYMYKVTYIWRCGCVLGNFVYALVKAEEKGNYNTCSL